MRLLFTVISVCLLLSSTAQTKGANTIKVIGVTFKEAVDKLLDAGYVPEKIDSNFQTVKTEFKISEGKNKNVQLSLFVRIKDSTAIITGKTFNSGMVGATLFGTQISKDAATLDIENSSGTFKKVFSEMNSFALSFKKPIEYSISK